MKPIFPKSIGDLRTLGTRREWLLETAAALLGTVIFVLIYILA